jgi:hypothetical protein
LETAIRTIRMDQRPWRQTLAVLREYHRTAWNLGHASAIFSVGLSAALEGDQDLLAATAQALPGFITQTRSSAIALLVAWAAGGVSAADEYLRRFASADALETIEASLALTALAVRDPNSLSLIRPAFAAARRSGRADGVDALRRRLAVHGLQAIDHVADARAVCIEVGRQAYRGMTVGVGAAPEIDDVVACAIALREPHAIDTEPSDADLEHVFRCLAAIAGAPLEELYLPRAVSKIVTPAWSLGLSQALIREPKCPGKPLRRAAPRRHEPCPCGSRRKFARCCIAGSGNDAAIGEK